MTTIAIDTLVLVPLTAQEIVVICEKLRYEASELAAVATIYQRNEASRLRGLAYELEARYRAAVIEAGRVEVVGEETD